MLEISQIHSSSQPRKPFLCLLDSGATGCWISREKLPPHIRTYHVAPVTNQTLAGNFTANEEVNLQGVLLPEFHKTRRLQTLMAKIFDQGCRYCWKPSSLLSNVHFRNTTKNCSTSSFALNFVYLYF